MKKHHAMWLLASVLSSVGGGICAAATAEVGHPPAADPLLEMVTTLEPTSPRGAVSPVPDPVSGLR